MVDVTEPKMKADFGSYEYVSHIAPGTIVLLALAVGMPELKHWLGGEGGVDLGSLGVLIILAFIAGHISQGIGSLLEAPLWEIAGGHPTKNLAQKGSRYVNYKQRDRFLARVSANYGVPSERIDASVIFSLSREIYVYLLQHGRSGRIDMFNRQFGLYRGLSVAFFVCIIIAIFREPTPYTWMAMSLCACLVCIYRAWRFGHYYTRELVVEYLNLNP